MALINGDYTKNYWIGAHDIGVEGSFRMMNGTRFEPSDETSYDWTDYKNNPDNHQPDEDCVHIWTTYNGLNDLPCDR